MEHISRGILPKVDTIILVSDCSRRGVQAVGRITRADSKNVDLQPDVHWTDYQSGRRKVILNAGNNGGEWKNRDWIFWELFPRMRQVL